MSEHSFWTLVRNNLGLKMYRVENRVMKGMPDVHYIQDGKSGWIELKYIADWPRKRIASGLMLNQAMWLQEYVEHKGRCWVLIRIGRDFIGLVDGRDAKVLHDRPSTKDFYSLLAWKKHGNMKTADWVELADVIVGPPAQGACF
jgi:hypothetical protein